METVLTSQADHVLTITLNRPDRLNAVTTDLFRELSDACAEASDPDIRAVIVTGAGRGFCAGADLTAPVSDTTPGSRRQRRFYNPTIIELASLDKPVIAAVNGAAVGAGLSIAAAADIRIASERARFGCGFVDVGLAPDTGTSLFLERILGYNRAFYFLAMGQLASAAEALNLGLVNEVVSHEGLLDRAEELAALLADKPGIGVATTKSLLRAAATASLVEQLEAESVAYDLTSVHPGRLAARSAMAGKLKGTNRDL